MYQFFKLSEFKVLIFLAIPILFSQLFQMGMGVTDVAIAGHYNKEALAAVSLGVSVWHPLMLFVAGTLMSFSILSAHYYGARHLEKIPEVLRDGLYIALVLCIIVIIIMCFPAPILRFFKADAERIIATTTYLRALCIGVPAMFLFFCLRYIAEGARRPIPVLIVSIVGFVLNGILNYSLVNGVAVIGVPELGLFGSGLGTGLTFWVMLIVMIFCVRADHRLCELKIFSKLGLPDFANMKQILKLGLPNGASTFAEVSIFSIAALMLGRFSDEIIGSHQIALNISSVAFAIPLSMSFALTAVIGQAAGRGDKLAAIRIGRMGIITCFLLMFVTVSILYVGRFILPALFTENALIIKMSATLLIYAAIFQIPDGLQIAANGALRGIKDTKIPMFICITAYWLIGIPMSYILGIVYDLQAQGIWIGLILGLTVAAFMLNIRFYILSKRMLSK